MPTPSPIIETSSGVIVLTSVSPARRKSRRNAVATAVMASASGIVVATKVRKTMSSTIRAASRPSSSCVPCSIGGNSASPLNSTVTPAGVDRLADSILDGDDRLAILRVDHPVELGLRVRDAPVVGDRVLGERRLDALEARLVLRRLELRPAELRDRLVDRLLPLGRVEPLPRGSGKDDVQHAALLFGELGLDQVGRLLRVRARDLELVAEGSGERDGEDDEHGEDAEPRADDAPGVRRAAPHPAGQRLRSKVVRALPAAPCRPSSHVLSSCPFPNRRVLVAELIAMW